MEKGLSISFNRKTKLIPVDLDLMIEQKQLDLKKKGVEVTKHSIIIDAVRKGLK